MKKKILLPAILVSVIYSQVSHAESISNSPNLSESYIGQTKPILVTNADSRGYTCSGKFDLGFSFYYPKVGGGYTQNDGAMILTTGSGSDDQVSISEISHRSWKTCYLDDDKYKNIINKNHPAFANAIPHLELKGLNLNTLQIQAGIDFRNEDLRSVVASGTDRIRTFFKLGLNSCLTTTGEIVSNFSDNENVTNLSEMIRQLRSRGYRNYLRCTLTTSGGITIADTLTDGLTVQSGTNNFHELNYDLQFQSETPDKVILTQNGAFMDQFIREGAPRNPANEQLSLVAAKNLISFIEDDYADFLYSLNNQAISEANRNEAIRAYFAKNSNQIQTFMQQINAHFADVSLMNKISMITSLQDCYSTIAKVEQTLTHSSPISLDRIIHQH